MNSEEVEIKGTVVGSKETVNKKRDTTKMVILAMFTTMAFVLTFFIRIPSGFLPFLEYDLKNSIISIAGFAFGPIAPIIISIVEATIEMLLFSDTGYIGMIMNVIATTAFASTAALVYKFKKNIVGAVIGLVLGGVMMTIMMILWNYFITPMYMGVSREAIGKLLVPAFLPFNLIKSVINIAVCLVFYKPVMAALKKIKIKR